MTKDEALKLALEALETLDRVVLGTQRAEDAITAIKEALAQPEQELLAWKNAALRVGEDLSSVGPKGYYNMTAQQWLDWAMAQQPRGNNSLAQPEQEFVAYIDMSEWPPVRFKEGTLRCDIAHLDGQKLYTTPPQRKPLTDERIWHLVDIHVSVACPSHPLDNSDWVNFARAIEAAHGIKGEA